MEKTILNYRVIVEPDIRVGTDEKCYTAYCPTLGIADSGNTIEEALLNIHKGIEVWIEALTKEGESIPADHLEDSIVAFTSIKAPANIRLAT